MKSKNGSDILIFPATAADADAMVPLIYSSGPKAWDFVFTHDKIDVLHFLRNSFINKNNTISYQNHFVAWLDGKIVGSILSYKQPIFTFYTLGTAFQILKIYGFNFPKVIYRGLKVETMIQPPKVGVLYLGHVAVAESARRLGIAKKMILFMIQNKDNFSKIALDVSIENLGAISLYQSLGFEIKETRVVKGFEKILPPHYYMELLNS